MDTSGKTCIQMILLLGLLIFATPLSAQGTTGVEPSVQEFLLLADQAKSKENYTEAIRILEEGKKLHPSSPLIPGELGSLYFLKSLYPLALEEYRSAVEKAPDDLDYNLRVADCLGLLNRNTESILTFENALERFPGDIQLIQGLAWMYFKVEDYQKAVDLLESARAELGGHKSFSMTLGSLYSSMYEYRKSREAYQDGISRALEDGDREFASIAYYNLSILETSFLNYEKAFEAVEESLRLVERSPGYMALGELYQTQMNFRRAAEVFEKADLEETTPLTKMDMAKLYRQFGFLDQAAAYLEKVESVKDDSWMYGFGVTRERWQQEIAQTWWEIWKGRAHQADFTPRFWPWEWAFWAWDKIRFSLLAWFNEQKSRDLLITLAQGSLGRSNNPQGWWSLFKATDSYPWASGKYLTLARDFEVSRVEGMKPYYLMEEGRLWNDAAKLEAALGSLDPAWAGLEVTEALVALADKAQPALRRQILSRIYPLNPGALLQNGWSLPVQIDVFGGENSKTQEFAAKAEQWANSRGYDMTQAGGEGREYRLVFQLLGNDGVQFTLKDKSGRTVFQDFRRNFSSVDEVIQAAAGRIHQVN